MQTVAGNRNVSRLGLAVASLAASFAAQALVPLENIAAVAAGYRHTCALTTQGGVKCWGRGSSTLLDVTGLTSGVASIAAGNDHTCAVTNSGAVKCWPGGRVTPADVPNLATGVVAVAGGYWHSCALTNSGGVKCWGNNRYGQLGNNASGDNASSDSPVDVVGLTSGVAAVTAGYFHSCALTTSGGVKCWGINGGQLGDGTTTQRPTAVEVVGLASGVTAIAAGADHTCALTASGAMKCWGGTFYGQLGNNSIGQVQGNSVYSVQATPVDVWGLGSGVGAIALGAYHSCAITTGGGAKCWGANDAGQLGDLSNAQRLIPVDVVSLSSGVKQLAGGYHHSCAVTTAGGLKCWGDNEFGQLGISNASQRVVPTDAFGLTTGVASIAAGEAHTCAVTGGGGVKCWGFNFDGQLGNNSDADGVTPVDVFGLASGVSALAAGSGHTCALTTGGGVKCWGENFYGQLGIDPGNLFRDDFIGWRRTPVNVVGLGSGVVAIAAGDKHSCALTSGGSTKCWGYQRGDNQEYKIDHHPEDVPGLSGDIVAIAVGADHTCAVTTGGGARCRGDNSHGQLGDNTLSNRGGAVDVQGLTNGVAGIAAGEGHTCALIAGGGVKCWGDNSSGQLGDNSTTQRLAPVNVVGLASGVTRLVAGGSHTCALMASGSVKCWGNNSSGQLGDNSTTNRLTPVDSQGLGGGVAAIAAGGGHTCAVTNDGGVKCWGGNSKGQLGNGEGRWRTFPADVQVEWNAPGALTGLWWNASESGWGIHFTQRRNIVFAAWYTYDAAGNPRWYVASSCAMPAGTSGTTGTCGGELYEVNGPTFFGTPFNTSALHVSTVGSLRVTFLGANSASLTYTADGQTRTVALARQQFANGPAPGVNYTDLWWNPNESGWGIAVTQQAGVMFLAWYVYDGAGRPMWYVSPNCAVAGAGCTGKLYRTMGPPFGPTFNPAMVHPIEVGTVGLAFTDGSNGTLTYSVNGVNGSKPITRQLF